nr:hypothetical protein [uncultured Draconibacterium sp.]
MRSFLLLKGEPVPIGASGSTAEAVQRNQWGGGVCMQGLPGSGQ